MQLRILAALVLFLPICNCSSAIAQPTMSVTRVAAGLTRPVFATTAPGDPNRFFIVEQRTGSNANIKILDLSSGTVNAQSFLTISGVATNSEQGLLGMAFHPDYASNGLFYVNFTNSAGHTTIREYARQTADLADPNSGRAIMTINQPFPNHNGGWMGFDSSGFLNIATGDGGDANDPQNNAQDITNNLLGKILRVDVNGDDFGADPTRNYAIPSSNPFVGQTGDDEIWAYGLRNPWRASFDRVTGDLYIADVGQGALEEINVQPGSSTGGENYGWRVREGTNGPDLPGAIDPIYDYEHGTGDLEGFSVTGGYVYRGPIEELQEYYFFADYVTDRIWSLKWDGTDPSLADGTNFTDFIDWTDVITSNVGSIANISSFAEDSLGNLYIIDHAGEIFRIDAASIPEPNFGLLIGMIAAMACVRSRRRWANESKRRHEYDL